jgi:hypothetical protein
LTRRSWQGLYEDQASAAAAGEGERASGAVQVENEIRYAGYVALDRERIERQRKHASRTIPDGFDYGGVRHLRAEAREQLARIRPRRVKIVPFGRRWPTASPCWKHAASVLPSSAGLPFRSAASSLFLCRQESFEEVDNSDRFGHPPNVGEVEHRPVQGHQPADIVPLPLRRIVTHPKPFQFGDDPVCDSATSVARRLRGRSRRRVR